MFRAIAVLSICGLFAFGQPAFGADQHNPSATDMYYFACSQFQDGELVGDCTVNFLDIAGSGICQICATDEPGGMPACFMLILPPQAWTGAPWLQIKENLHGKDMPPLRQLTMAGLRIYYYFPDANDVRFDVSVIKAGETDKRWVGAVTVAQ